MPHIREIKEYDSVTLKDGRRGCVVEILGDGKAFLIDVGSCPADWENIYVELEEIESVT